MVIFGKWIVSSILRLWGGLVLLVDVFNECFLVQLKRINRLISKGMSNIYLKVTIEKNWYSQSFDILSLKSSSSGQLLASSNSRRYDRIFKLLVVK